MMLYQLDYIDPRFGIPLAIFLWLVVAIIFFREAAKRGLNDFFAHRRHVRREKRRQERGYSAMRAYTEGDLTLTRAIYKANQPRHSAKTR